MSGKYAMYSQMGQIRVQPVKSNVVQLKPKPEPIRTSGFASLLNIKERPKTDQPWLVVIEHSADINRKRMDGYCVDIPSDKVVESVKDLNEKEIIQLKFYLKKLAKESPYQDVKIACAKKLLSQKAKEIAKTKKPDDELAELAVQYNELVGKEDGKGRLRSKIQTEIGTLHIDTLTEFTGVKMERPGASFTLMSEYVIQHGRRMPNAISHFRAGYGETTGSKPEVVLTALSVELSY